MSERTTREWALLYSGLGWRVFPVVTHGKRPLYRGWQRDATTDPQLVARYWRSEPGPNIGIVTGERVAAIDIEAAHLARFRAWLEASGRQLPATPIARTGRGGIHILVGAAGHPSRVLRLDGVHIGELKATGGFIVACPSRTESAYAWLTSPEEAPSADAPTWLDELLPEVRTSMTIPTTRLGPSRAVALTAGLYRTVAQAHEGERNGLLFWAACRAAEHGLDAAAAADILLAAAREAGLPEPEARRTIASGFER